MQPEMRTRTVDQTALTVSHNILYACKTKKYVKYKPNETSSLFRTQFQENNELFCKHLADSNNLPLTLGAMKNTSNMHKCKTKYGLRQQICSRHLDPLNYKDKDGLFLKILLPHRYLRNL